MKKKKELLPVHFFSVTLFTLGFRLFFYSAANKQHFQPVTNKQLEE
jgi:hypothetical protein